MPQTQLKASSPFTLQQNWELSWTYISKQTDKNGMINCTKLEKKILHLINTIGVIDEVTLSRLFSITNKKKFKKFLKKMSVEHKIVRHNLTNEKQTNRLCTLGVIGSIIVENKFYEPNYWDEYNVSDVIKRMLFFRLYNAFSEMDEHTQVNFAPSPFIGAINVNDRPINVYVLRGSPNDILNYFKWKKNYMKDRIIIITENLRHVIPLFPFIKDSKVRITTDKDLLANNSVRDMFYFLDDDSGEIYKEA